MSRSATLIPLVLLAIAYGSANAGPTGLINMPSGRIDPDGTLRLNLSYAYPYQDISANLTLLPFLETNIGVTGIKNVPGFSSDTSYGNYKDKTTGLKIKIFDEIGWRPAVAVGSQDFIGTKLLQRNFISASKSIGEFDFTLGYGNRLINGPFGGVRYSPTQFKNWSLIAEYDASDFSKFPFAMDTKVSERTPGVSYALQYQWGWINTAISRQRGGENGFSTYVTIPLEKQWIPQFAEPEPYTKVLPRPKLDQWEADASHRVRLAEALARQNFQDIKISFSSIGRLDISLGNNRISTMSRAVGRAARTALLLSPIETRQIRITYTNSTLPVATYDFFDLQKLNRYFNGMLTRKALSEYVAIHYASPDDYQEGNDELMNSLEEPIRGEVLYGTDGNLISLRSRDINLNSFQLKPLLRTYLNGPGAFQYSLSAIGSYDRRLGERTFFSAGMTYPISENISKGFAEPDNSGVPVVRSDLPQYRAGERLKIERLIINQFYHLSERTYARLSAGLYEEMYGGVGGQWLYVPRKAAWAFDISIDAVQKRAPSGYFEFQDYRTVTAIGAFHYKMPYKSTATIRMGRFLARDLGARFELKRRFDSGMEMGAWYTITNANDRGGPAAQEGGVYYDKGLFFSIPFSSLLGQDSRAVGAYALSPWGRDPGQLVVPPADLYSIIERPLMGDMHERDGLVRFGDIDDEYNLPDLGSSILDKPFERIGGMLLRDFADGPGTLAGKFDQALIGTGLVLSSALLDKKADDLVKPRLNNKWIKHADQVGKGLPLLGMGLAGVAFLSAEDKRLSTTGLAALQAGGIGLLGNLGIKEAVGRARPVDELGTRDFAPGKRSDASFGSNHTTVIWAAVTPFAREYEAPWLYGVAAMTNIGRVASRQHWISDTVASSLIGYAIGSFFWDQRRKPKEAGPEVGVSPSGVTMSWPLK